MRNAHDQNKASKVSIIIPTYNRCSWIKHAIDSVMQQSYQDFELIVVDDGSTDITKSVLIKYEMKIRYFFQANSGPAAARNLGISKANGSYVCFLDSDDRWLKGKLQSQINLIEKHPEIKICYTDEIWIRNGNRINQKKIHQKFSGWIYQKCLPLCIISPSSVLVQREVFEKIGLFDEKMIVCEDYDLWLRASHVYPIQFINKPLIVKYGGHADQLSNKYWGMDRYRIKAMIKMLKANSLSIEDRKATIHELHKKCDILVNGFFKRGKIDQGDFYLQLKEKYVT